MRSMGWVEHPATIDAIPPSTNPLIPISENQERKSRSGKLIKFLGGNKKRKGKKQSRELIQWIKKTNWKLSSSHWKPGDENGGRRLWMRSEERWLSETYATERKRVAVGGEIKKRIYSVETELGKNKRRNFQSVFRVDHAETKEKRTQTT
ncbi:unnamed protein product [Cuscuta europaea]|uniref:Uncharacterized protein n=1 Tax=Cuscuta europaea TaxID=41803 RepID=A0A9P0ZU06_CUSEU|nr:unnamed protein product [Cuscuta europaea]